LSRFIVDASVALCWYFEDQAAAYTEAVFECLAQGDQALVPSVWPLEMVNALVVAWRQKSVTSEQLEDFIADLKDLPVEVDSQGSERVYSSIFRMSCQHQLSSYDAAYLDLAVFEGLPLATLDKNLRAAARRLRIEIFNPRKPAKEREK
jgi:predicted nucleic acid-binding protein